MNYDLRNSSGDGSQRMLNAMEPGTLIPVHRHTKSSETVVVIRGAIRQNFYDDGGNVTESVIYRAGAPVPICVVPINAWHNSESLLLINHQHHKDTKKVSVQTKVISRHLPEGTLWPPQHS